MSTKLQKNEILIFPINDEIFFWGQQILEHMFILLLGIQDIGQDFRLHYEATQLYHKWHNFMDRTFYDKGIKINSVNIMLPEKYINIQVKTNDVIELLDESIKFNKHVVDVLKSGTWIGCIYPSLASHMLEEAEYFRGKITGNTMSIRDEIIYINHHNSSEMAVTAQLIDPDPSQQDLINIIKKYADANPTSKNVENKFKDTDIDNMLVSSIRYDEELIKSLKKMSADIRENKIKSIISPLLSSHVMREFIRFNLTLKRLHQLNGSNSIGGYYDDDISNIIP